MSSAFAILTTAAKLLAALLLAADLAVVAYLYVGAAAGLAAFAGLFLPLAAAIVARGASRRRPWLAAPAVAGGR